MTKKKTRVRIKQFRRALSYVLMAAATIAVVFVGSLDKRNSSLNSSLMAFAEGNYDKISVDQITELYMVAGLSDMLGLASASDAANNYVLTTSMYEAGQTSSGKIDKPSITNLPVSRGVIEYTVSDGETMDSIATKYGITTDQIRWSNGLKTTDISAGTKLYLPSTSGIIYTVKSGDTVESIVSKYGGTYEEIIALNDLEVSGISEGMRILIKNGTLPTTERPEYVAPTAQYYYTYLGNSSTRQDIQVIGYKYGLGGPYVAGQCTQWAWYNRKDLPSNLGNANTWARRAAAIGYRVNHTPSVGAIFQTTAGWYGHVGYVEAVNADGSIVVSEMNYTIPGYRPNYLVIRSTIPASAVGNFNYIHKK